MNEIPSGAICPRVLAWMQRQTDKEFRPRFRSLVFQAPLRTPVEQLAQVNRAPQELGPEHTAYQTIQFDLPVILVARSAAVIDWSDPKRRLPGNGLRLFRAKIESSFGDQLDISKHPAGPVGDCFWGTGSRPATIPGGAMYEPGSYMFVKCLPRIPDIEVELGFWTMEIYRANLR